MIGKCLDNELTTEFVVYVATIVKDSLSVFLLVRIKFPKWYFNPEEKCFYSIKK